MKRIRANPKNPVKKHIFQGSKSSLRKHIAKTLLHLRMEAGYSLRQLEELVGLPNQHLSMLESGKSSPNVHTLNTLIQFYGVEPGIFFLEKK